MVVLSLFDGMSCGQIALRDLGIIPDVYYASEIDKHAIMQTNLNFPDTIQLGSVTDVDVSKLPKIDMLLGGSPCQSFSFAGKRNGMTTVENEEIYTLDRYVYLKEQGFQFEGQSYLFWEYMRILTDIRKYNPNVLFLLENVEMGKKWERVLSEAIGIYGVHINSGLVSAQNRKRVYWTNIRTNHVGLFGDTYSDISQPDDRGIFLRDALEDCVDEKYYLSDKVVENLLIHKKRNEEKGNGVGAVFHEEDQKMQALKVGGKGIDDLIIQRPRGNNKGNIFEGKTPTLSANSWEQNNLLLSDRIRRLTPTECARLQTVPSWYKWECSDTQQYKMLGNGWTIEVIKHIFKHLNLKRS